MNHSKDKIRIKGLFLRCIIGINDDERIKKQDVIINITMFCDLSISGNSDSINDTVDYSKMKKRIVAMVENSSYYLIEKLAQAIADICLENNLIEKVCVSVDKPGALRYTKSVSVEIERSY